MFLIWFTKLRALESPKLFDMLRWVSSTRPIIAFASALHSLLDGGRVAGLSTFRLASCAASSSSWTRRCNDNSSSWAIPGPRPLRTTQVHVERCPNRFKQGSHTGESDVDQHPAAPLSRHYRPGFSEDLPGRLPSHFTFLNRHSSHAADARCLLRGRLSSLA